MSDLPETLEEPGENRGSGARSALILAALAQNAGEWQLRADIAAAIGKNRLNPVDIAFLDKLAQSGEIQKALRPTPKLANLRWAYQIKTGQARKNK